MHDETRPINSTSRREFLKTSSAAALGGVFAANLSFPESSFAGNSDTLKIGLIGCGGRGTGAASQALHADKNVVLTAMADVFEDQIEKSHAALKNDGEIAGKVNIDDEHRFLGLDAYQKLLASGVDVVILTTPPAFRPAHLHAAVGAGKHIFCEKPAATDAPGIRSVLASVAEATRKNLALVAGFCWRYNLAERALFERVLNGAIGDLSTFYGTYYTGPVNPIPPASDRKAGMTDLAWALRYWQNFTWLSGDSLVEQAVHAIDWMCWAMKDVPPVKAIAVGGRQVPANGGNIFDHFEINYEYADGARGFIGSRQQSGCANDNTATIYGTKGNGHELGFSGMPFIKGATDWRYKGPRPNMYQIEHDEMFASIRAGNPINNGVRLAHSTLTAIMGRMAAYTGQVITWDMALNSQENLVPENLDWSMTLATPPFAIPGVTKFV